MWVYNYSVPHSTDEIKHHGVLGMKWGVRRYQNPDGSLTTSGKKRYNRMSDDELYNDLHKNVKDKRAKVHGHSNKARRDLGIGKESETVITNQREAYKKWINSPEYKKATIKAKKIEDRWKLVEEGRLSEKDWNKEHDEAFSYFENKGSEFGSNYRITAKGRVYSETYLNGAGKQLTYSYIKDLGYNDSVAKTFTNRLLKSRNKILE